MTLRELKAMLDTIDDDLEIATAVIEENRKINASELHDVTGLVFSHGHWYLSVDMSCKTHF